MTTAVKFDFFVGKTGAIYSARNGTVTIVKLDDDTVWQHNNLAMTNVFFTTTCENWWRPTAAEVPMYMYKTMRLTPSISANPTYQR